MIYKPYAERTPDYQYGDLLKKILKEGRLTRNPHQKVGTITHTHLPPMVFPLANGVPLITERKIGFWRKPIAEIIAFINGVRTLGGMAEVGCDWWKTWATPEKCARFGLEAGDLGQGSYGAAFHDFPMHDGSTFNQFEHLIRQMKEMPGLRTHVISPWIPYLTLQHSGLQRKVVVAPCHGWIQITIFGSKMHFRMDQRSADMPVGVPSNMIQYAALALMIGQVTGLEPEFYIHSPHDAQIYEDQVPKIEELLVRTPRPFPTLTITDTSITDLFAFRPEHFELTDYDPHPAMNDIPVTE